VRVRVRPNGHRSGCKRRGDDVTATSSHALRLIQVEVSKAVG
jgi:hypothetical protein